MITIISPGKRNNTLKNAHRQLDSQPPVQHSLPERYCEALPLLRFKEDANAAQLLKQLLYNTANLK